MRNLFRSLIACSLASALAITVYAQNTETKKVEPRPKQNTPSLRKDDQKNVNRPQNERPQANDRADQGAQVQRGALDRYAASCVATENQNEVTIAQIAAKKAQNPEVKAFAEMLVKDHTAFLEKVRPFDAAKGNRADKNVGETSDRKTTRITAEPRPADERAGAEVVRDANRPESNANATVDRTQGQGHHIPVRTLIQVKDEIAQKCLASTQRELQAKQGDEFDRCFIGMQIGAHMKMVDSLSVVQNHVSPELQQILSEGVESSQRHLTEAKKLMESLEKNRDSKTAGADKAKPQ